MAPKKIQSTNEAVEKNGECNKFPILFNKEEKRILSPRRKNGSDDGRRRSARIAERRARYKQ